jgi:Holliday junction resolvasome RuvABC DNA-binding subunit
MHWADEQQRQWRRQQQQREEEQQRRLDARREAAQSFDAIVQMGFSPEAAANALAAWVQTVLDERGVSAPEGFAYTYT